MFFPDRRGPESSQEDGLQNVFHREVTDEVQGMVEFSNRIEVKINSPRSVSIPPHHTSKFTSKQSSLHALVVKRESSKKGFPDLLCTACLRGIVLLKDLEGVSERFPEHLETTIEYVFQRVAIRFVQVRPGAFLRVIDSGLGVSDESPATCATREQPPELYAEEQKEAEDVTREIFVLLDNAASPSRVVSWNKITSVPRTAAIVVAARASSARTGATTGRWSGRSVFLVRHVLAPNTREVDAIPAACDRESAARVLARSLARSARSNMQ
jgi:hypothetical protein